MLKNDFMKVIISVSLMLLVLVGCGIGQQAKEMKTLGDCTYRIVEINSILISGTNVKELISKRDLSLTNIPSLALGFITKSIPLKADLIVEISNPTNNYAAINYFDYEILVNKAKLAEGSINERIDIAPQGVQELRLAFTKNIYEFLINDSIRNDIQQFITGNDQSGRKTTITIRVKPAMLIGDQLVHYPGFIDIQREFNNEFLL
jgi:LEA14-like dessication related protein